MTDYTNTSLELPDFETTKLANNRIEKSSDGTTYMAETMYGIITTEKPIECPHCKRTHSLEINQHLFATLKHLYLGHVLLCIHVEYVQYWFNECSKTCMQEIPFKQNLKPTHYSQYIDVDEFSLHKGHHYATLVIDWQTGEILCIEEGNVFFQHESWTIILQ